MRRVEEGQLLTEADMRALKHARAQEGQRSPRSRPVSACAASPGRRREASPRHLDFMKSFGIHRPSYGREQLLDHLFPPAPEATVEELARKVEEGQLLTDAEMRTLKESRA